MALITPDRTEAVQATLARIRAAGDDLEQVRAALAELALRPDLFPSEHFPIEPGSQGGIFRLADYEEGGPAVYLSVGRAAGRGILRLREVLDVGPGQTIAFRPGEFHYLVVTSEETSLQLQAYGVPIERWTGLLPVFPAPDSGVYDLIPARLAGLHIADPVV